MGVPLECDVAKVVLVDAPEGVKGIEVGTGGEEFLCGLDLPGKMKRYGQILEVGQLLLENPRECPFNLVGEQHVDFEVVTVPQGGNLAQSRIFSGQDGLDEIRVSNSAISVDIEPFEEVVGFGTACGQFVVGHKVQKIRNRKFASPSLVQSSKGGVGFEKLLLREHLPDHFGSFFRFGNYCNQIT